MMIRQRASSARFPVGHFSPRPHLAEVDAEVMLYGECYCNCRQSSYVCLVVLLLGLLVSTTTRLCAQVVPRSSTIGNISAAINPRVAST
jgi:hypothetical protein